MHTQYLLDGSSVTVYSPQEWFDLFVDHCNNVYAKEGNRTGKYCCGYHWCCNECKQELSYGCADCVQTMINILESFGYKIDYSDIDFDALEERIRKLYESK